MNKARWDSLPDDIKKAFKRRLGREWWGEVGEIWRALGRLRHQGRRSTPGNEHIVLTEDETAGLQASSSRWSSAGSTRSSRRASTAQALVEKARELIAEYTQRHVDVRRYANGPRRDCRLRPHALITAWALLGGLVLLAVVAINVASVDRRRSSGGPSPATSS